jgi:hypothetical protein
MKKKIYTKFIQGKVINDCSVLNKENIVFGLKEEQFSEDDRRPIEERDTIMLSYAPNRLQENGGFGHIVRGSGIEQIYVCFKTREIGIIYCDTDFNTFEPNVDPDNSSPVLPQNKQDDYTRGAECITYIAGEAYIAGFLRKVFKRTGVYQWVDLTDEQQHPNLFRELAEIKKRGGKYSSINTGFSAIDGFAANDIYAGGDRGDTWHYDGHQWQIVDIPGNFNIKTITCAEDGNVYIAGYSGGVIKGRGDDWEIIEPDSGYVFYSSAWFQGKLYLGGYISGLYILEGNKIERYKFTTPGRKQYSFNGGVASSEDALVLYGDQQVLVYDGKTWEEIIGFPVLSEDG